MAHDPDRYQYRAEEDEFEIDLEDSAADDPYLNQYTSSSQSLHTYKQILNEDWLDKPLRKLLEDRIHALNDG